MTEPDVTIRFETVEGLTPNADNVIRALSAYLEILKVAATIVAPDSRPEIGLAGVEDGSDIFKFILRSCENFGEHLTGGMSEYPLVGLATITLGGLIGSTMIVIGLQNQFSADPRIPADQIQIFEENNRLLRESIDLQRREMEFYGILQEEPAYSAVEVIRPYDGHLIYRVPREQFAARSGLWMAGDDAIINPTSQTKIATWDVVLIKPVLIGEPRRWRFVRDGLEFSALMNDRAMLEAIHNRTLSVPLAEGIRMKVELKYREDYLAGAWIPVTGSHRITKVLDPLPPLTTSPLFPSSNPPKE